MLRCDRTECLDPLLTALSKGTFLSENLENVAIRGAFWIITSYCEDSRTLFVTRFFDHPAISAESYSDALYLSYKHGSQAKESFKWLVARADHQDLKVVKGKESFARMRSDFQEAVNQTVGIESRHKLRRPERVTAAKEASKEYFPNDLVNLIGEYIE